MCKMNLLVTVAFLTVGAISIDGVSSLNLHSQKGGVLKRAVRGILNSKVDNLIPEIQSMIIENCKKNSTVNLQEIYDNMKTCIVKKKMFVTPKQEFLSNVEKCSSDAVKETKNCLPEDKKYFPEFMLAEMKSFFNFAYENINIFRGDFLACVPNILVPEAQKNFEESLTKTAKIYDDSRVIPPKATLCKQLIPISTCFTDLIKERCEHTPNMERFRGDYIKAISIPCEN